MQRERENRLGQQLKKRKRVALKRHALQVVLG